MDIPLLEYGGDLDSGQKLESERRRRLGRGRDPRHGVVVGDTQGANAGVMSPGDKVGGIEPTIRGGRVEVKIDHRSRAYAVALRGLLAGRRRAGRFD